MVSFRYFVLIMGKDKKKDVKTLSIRLPKSVAVALQKRAKRAQRSINKQIVHEIELNGLPQTERTESATYFREANIALTGQP